MIISDPPIKDILGSNPTPTFKQKILKVIICYEPWPQSNINKWVMHHDLNSKKKKKKEIKRGYQRYINHWRQSKDRTQNSVSLV